MNAKQNLLHWANLLYGLIAIASLAITEISSDRIETSVAENFV
jgi:hypothetical protein